MAYIFKSIHINFKLCRNCSKINRYYSRNVIWRKPIKVLNAVPQTKDSVSPVYEMGLTRHKEVTESSLKSTEAAIIPKSDKTVVVPYKKLEKNDASFTKLINIIKDRKRREKSGKILLEGKRLINDAIKAGLELKSLYFSREKDLVDIKLKNPEEVKVCKVLYQTLRLWSDLTTCPGVMGIFKRPTVDELSVVTEPAVPVTVLCDNIREPGNLGSIIRNAAAAGCENILLTKGCVDPWESKVLRAACGGHFRIPIVNDIEWTQISNYFPSNSTIFVADNSGDIDMVSCSEGFINYDEPEQIEGEETKYVTFNEENQQIRVDESFDSKSELQCFEDIQLPSYLYSAVKYPEHNIVVYIGGETHGIDPRVNKLVCEFGGRRIKIPMENGMDSINSAFALTLILYEIKRQRSQLYITK